MRLTIRVRPGSARAAVAGSPEPSTYASRSGPDPHDGAALVVRVTAPAVDGRATEAALRTLAAAFGVRRRDVILVTGATSRTKIVDVGGLPEAELRDRLERLCTRPDGSGQ